MPNYSVQRLKHFGKELRLGVAGGNIEQYVNGKIAACLKDLNTVRGAVQFVRRERLEQTGGLPASKHRGEGTAKEIAARM